MHRVTVYCQSLWWALALLLLSVFATGASAKGLSTGWLTNPDHPPVQTRFVLTGEKDSNTKTLQGFLEVRLSGNWKTYWRSPGEGGIAPSMTWQDSENLTDIQWFWPHPDRFELLGIETLGYKNEVVFPMTLHVEDMDKPVALRAKLSLPTCTTVCVTTDYPFELTFTPAKLTPSPEFLHTYAKGMNLVPKPSVEIKDLSASWDSATGKLQVSMSKASGWSGPDIIVDGNSDTVADYTFTQQALDIKDKTLTATFTVSSWLGEPVLDGETLSLTLGDKGFIAEHSITVGATALPSSTSAPIASIANIAKFVLFALLGGLILNIMPCVLPVLGMKLNTVIAAQGTEKRQIRRQFIASAAGILVSFWLIALFLTLLKLSGNAIGWGIQFQNPYFIGFMVLVTGVFAANMLGLFEIQLSSNTSTWLANRGDNSYQGHFAQGMFATLLATPCSAPFLGTAVAFALSTDVITLFAIFSALAMGMALPWLVVAAFPSLANALPKPGPWMNKVKLLFGIMMLATTLWLLTLLTSHIPMFLLLSICAVAGGLLLWRTTVVYGKKTALGLAAAIVVFAAVTLITVQATDHLTPKTTSEELIWAPLSEQRITEAVSNGKTVFVDVTADWCITCKANKVGVLMQEPVYSRLQRPNIIPMQGDWTVPSESVTAYLQKYGRFGVPFNIVYGPAAPEGIPLPVILSEKAVMDAIDTAQGK